MLSQLAAYVAAIAEFTRDLDVDALWLQGSASYFERAFRRVLQLSPLKYRAVMHPRGANRQLYSRLPKDRLRRFPPASLRREIPPRKRKG